MGKGISPKLPLATSSEDGKYVLNKTLKEAVAQNLKHLLLTIPGERIMNPDFGVGLKTFLFRENSVSLYNEIRARIDTQVGKYMPFVRIQDIQFVSALDDPVNISDNALFITLSYHIIPLGLDDNLDLNVG